MGIHSKFCRRRIMSGNNSFDFSLNGSASTSNSTPNQEAGNSKSVIYDSRRNNYTSPQENFHYPDFKKPSVDWDHEVDVVYNEEITKLSGTIQGGEQKNGLSNQQQHSSFTTR